MTPIGKCLAFALIAWFGALLLLVIIRVLSDKAPTTGLLVTNPGSRGGVDPERVIAAAIVPSVLAFYTIHALHTGAIPTATGLSMPDLPEGLVSLLTGGNGLYLAGK